MNRWRWCVALGVCLGVSGCARVQTRVVEMPRVDQAVQGNRGYLKGIGPATARAPRKATRQVIMTDVELPTIEELNPIKGAVGPTPRGSVIPAPSPTAAPRTSSDVRGRERMPPPMSRRESWPEAPPAGAGPWLPPEPPPTMASVPPPPAPPAESASATTYTVQKGDTLEKIAKKVYGEATRWPRLYKANRQLLQNPNRVYPGQVLTIPPWPASDTTERASRRSSRESLK